MSVVQIEQTYLALKKWKDNPNATKKQIGVFSSWLDDHADNHRPLNERELMSMKQYLGQNAPSLYNELFGSKF